MGQFKPMVKMETTEPSVILKLKKGGHVNMKKGGKAESGHKKMAMGGAMDELASTPAFVGRPAMNAIVKSPGKPSMATRRKAMMAKKPAMAKKPPMPMMPPMAPPMKKGGKAEGGNMDKAQDKAMIKKAFKQHDAQEHKGGKGTDLKLKKGGKMATGGVAMSNAGGYKVGGEIDSKKPYTKMVSGGGPTKKMATGGVAMSNAGGYKDGGMSMVEKGGKMVPSFAADGKGKMKKGGMATGGVSMSNAGGYKKGGSTKKAFATGGTVNSGKPVAMPQGNKPMPEPKRQQNFSGTYKDGGEVAKKAMGGRMGQNTAQTIRTAPVGSSIATRDFFASKGKRPSYKDGGKVPKMAMGGVLNQLVAQSAGNSPPPAPSGGGVLSKAVQQAASMPKQPPAPPRMKSNFVGKVLGKGMSGLKGAFGRKDGGNVGNKSLQKINAKQNAPEVKDSKMDDNLKYPETMNSPQKTPKLKC